MTKSHLFDKVGQTNNTVRKFRTMLDQLRQVAIFAKTVDHGSFRGAARELNLSPSVVSHHISQLEEHLGVALLYRSTRKLALTREGEQLLASTHPMLSSVEDIFSKLSSSANSPSGELRLTTPSVLVKSHITELIADFSMRYKGVKLLLDYSDERQDMITDGHDIAIRMGIKTKSSLLSRTLFKVERRLIASTAYIRSKPKIQTPEELIDWDWIELSPVHHIKPSFQKPNESKVTIKPTAHISANDAQAVYCLARSGAGLAIVPEFLTIDAVASGALQYVLPDWQLPAIDVYACWPSNAPRQGLIKLFIDDVAPVQSLN